jgi:hypothetical protein
MNPDVFITIVFVGIAVLGALVGLVFVVPNARRGDARVARGGRHGSPRASVAEGSERETQTAAAKAGRDAAVH